MGAWIILKGSELGDTEGSVFFPSWHAIAAQTVNARSLQQTQGRLFGTKTDLQEDEWALAAVIASTQRFLHPLDPHLILGL
jgi:hypothetical protein